MISNNNLYGYSLKQLEDFALSLGYKKFSGRQMYQWMYQKGVHDFEEMTNLSKKFRAELQADFRIELPKIEEKQKSNDGTVKYLFKHEDNNFIEAVRIPEDSRLTLCISSQVGCPLGCRFCRTALIGYQRNLEVGEILAQIALIRDDLVEEDRITNLVFMGMGEPFLNYENLKSAIDIIRDVLSFGIGYKKITVSTAGHVPGIYRMTDEGLKVRLAVSLNCADQKLRQKIMPIAKKYPLTELKDAVRYYTTRFDCRVTFEYLLINEITDNIENARDLVKFVEGIPCKINLINYNPSDGLPEEYKPSTEGRIYKFRDFLYPRTPAVTIRESRGSDIMAACGQLAGKKTK